MDIKLMIFATQNQGKLEQVKQILRINNINIDIISAKDVKFNEEVIEDGKTFEENSEIKARALYNYCVKNNINNAIVFADDSGLCVDKLNGEPGVYSSRYAGENATEDEKRKLIIEKMKNYKNKNERTAKFVSTIVAILPNGEKVLSIGECKGSIAAEIGKTPNKLTYNQIFVPNGFDKPISEMTEDEFKNVHNHREKALLGLIQEIKSKKIFL